MDAEKAAVAMLLENEVAAVMKLNAAVEATLVVDYGQRHDQHAQIQRSLSHRHCARAEATPGAGRGRS